MAGVRIARPASGLRRSAAEHVPASPGRCRAPPADLDSETSDVTLDRRPAPDTFAEGASRPERPRQPVRITGLDHLIVWLPRVDRATAALPG